jgi:hypothetical protein
MDDNDMQDWAHQQQLEEEQWYCANDFTINREHYFSRSRNEFNRNLRSINTGE